MRNFYFCSLAIEMRRTARITGLVLSLLVLVASCSPERKLAKVFVETGNQKSVLLLSPDFIFKTSLKTDTLDSLGIEDENAFDSVLYATSVYLKEIDDSKFIDNYMQGMESELKVFGLNVYKENNTASFMEVDSSAYIINLAQLEVEEDYYLYRDETNYYGNYFYHDHRLNAFGVNSWLEISSINEAEQSHKVYYAQDMIVDDVDGEFTLDIFTGDVRYFFKIDTLKTEELYDYAYLLGRTYAGYTFDLLLNRYLDQELPRGADKKYWRYDPNTRTFFVATDDRFTPLDQ